MLINRMLFSYVNIVMIIRFSLLLTKVFISLQYVVKYNTYTLKTTMKFLWEHVGFKYFIKNIILN